MTERDGTFESDWILCVPFIGSVITFEQECVETLGDTQIKISPNVKGYKNLFIAGFESSDQARDQFEAVRTGLLAASLTTGMGIRIKDEVVQLADGAPPPDVDMPFIFKEGHDLRQLVIIPGKVQVQMAKFMPRFRQGLEFGLTSPSALTAMVNDRVRLAFEIYTDSFFETSDSARFLSLVGVLEVLKDQQAVSDDARSLVERWIEETSVLLPPEAKSFRSRLVWLREISIAQGIASVVTRHLGAERGKEAKNLYGKRSKLVHDGKRLIDSTSSVRRQAEQLIMDLLADILKRGVL
jgi:Apea-like HEPN